MRSLIISFIVSFVFIGCSDNGGEKSNGLLPPASGRAGDMIVVMDSAQWKGELGEEIRETFRAEVSGLPRDEPMFKLNHVDPRSFNDLLKSARNLLLVTTIDDNKAGSRLMRNFFTKSSLDKIKEDSTLFVHTAKDEFAKGQNVMYLFGQNSESLISHISKNKSKLQSYFNKAEKQRLQKTLYSTRESESAKQVLIKEHNCLLRVPFGYEVAVNDHGFIWFRQFKPDSDMNIFITYRPYLSEKVFEKEALIQLRDSIAKNELFEDPEKPETHIITETKVPYIPVETRRVNFNGKYAMEMRGLWKTNNLSMGGPFVSYTLVDEELGRLYYLEGFVYSPGKNQREFIRELEVILSTFKTKEQLRLSGS